MSDSDGKDKSWWDGEVKAAMTIGEFIRCMVDGGDQVAIVKVLERTEPDENRNYRLKMDVELMCSGHVLERLRELETLEGDIRIHTTLIALLNRRLIK